MPWGGVQARLGEPEGSSSNNEGATVIRCVTRCLALAAGWEAGPASLGSVPISSQSWVGPLELPSPRL